MQQSPCAICEHGHKSKHKARCSQCARRIAYVDSLEPAPECRHDPSYRGAYETPAMFARQMGHAPISSWDLIPF